MQSELSSVELSHPALFSMLEASHFGQMELDGGYPKGFLDFIYEKLAVTDPDQVVHLCSGSIKRGITVDIRPEMNAKYCCDARHTPIETGTCNWVVCDPPPSEIIQWGLYGLSSEEYPTPSELLDEACRILAPGGKVCLLAMVEPTPPPGLQYIGAYCLLMGPGYVVRGAFLYERRAS